MLPRMWRKRNPNIPFVGMYIGVATMENGMEASQNTTIEVPYDLAIPLLGIYVKKTETLIQIMPCSIAALLIITTIQNQPKYPLTDEWIRRHET